jgi:UDP-galactose transporter B1
MIPVMLMGTVLSGKRYSLFEYGCAGAIAGGVALFAGVGSGGKGGSHGSPGKSLAAPNAPLGYALCLLNLLLDGYTNAAQDELHSRFSETPPLWTMAWMNAWCALYNGLYLFGRLPGIGSSSSPSSVSAGSRLVRSLADSADARRDVALFCACGAVGQLFIFYTIARFGSLTNTIITTTRKFFNILLSVLWLGTPLQGAQWAAVALVFSGLGASSVAKARGKGKGTGGKSH